MSCASATKSILIPRILLQARAWGTPQAGTFLRVPSRMPAKFPNLPGGSHQGQARPRILPLIPHDERIELHHALDIPQPASRVNHVALVSLWSIPNVFLMQMFGNVGISHCRSTVSKRSPKESTMRCPQQNPMHQNLKVAVRLRLSGSEWQNPFVPMTILYRSDCSSSFGSRNHPCF